MTQKLLYPLRDFSAGYNDSVDPALLPDNALCEVENAIIGRGSITKKFGFAKYTVSALSSAIRRIYTFFKNAGPTEMLAVSNATLYKDNSGTLEPIPVYRYQTIEDCEDPWDESVNANVTGSIDTADKKAGNASVKLVVAAAAAANTILATEVIPATDISQGTLVRLWIKSSVATNAGDLQLLLDNTAACASPVYALSVPALSANEWKRVEMPYDGTVAGSAAIISIGLKYVVDIGACTIWLDDVDVRFLSVMTSSDTDMLTYKNRSLQDVVLIADGGKLKAYNPSLPGVVEVKPWVATTQEQTDPGLNDLANLTNFRSIAIKQDRIFALAHDKVRNRLSFCHHDPTLGYAVFDYWPAAFFFDLVSELNDESLLIRVFRDAIIVFNRKTVWSLTGDGRTINDYDLHRLNVPSGLLAPGSVAYVGNNLVYLSDDNCIYSLYSTDKEYISASDISVIKDSNGTIVSSVKRTLSGISREDKAKAIGTYFDGKYFLSFPSGLTLILDTTLNCWTKWTNIKANSFLERDGVLYFSSNTGHIYRMEPTANTDDGEAIQERIKTKKLDFGYPAQVKKFRTAKFVAKQFEAESSSFNVRVWVDDIEVDAADISTDISGVWDESEWDDVSWDFKDVVILDIRVRKKGYTIQYEITSNNPNEPFTLYQINQVFKIKKLKG
ncbi:hypothetical protein [Cohnella sp. AR92]|uniref:hypothetical protein n=1 Tax=Cohnella sp. AR92 TaxID=648716 RepID=UPI000F8CC462|nr:hypothetical protein [Cohnella sp. AR92]RUS42271.1 hypothetical protein ELR57_27040 [Cohnella sp. AR92]